MKASDALRNSKGKAKTDKKADDLKPQVDDDNFDDLDIDADLDEDLELEED